MAFGLGDFIPIELVAKALQINVHVSTVHRWGSRGVRGVKLRTIRIGGKRYVTRAALDEFAAGVTAAVDGERHIAPTTKTRCQGIAAAERQLDRRGV